MDRQFYLDLAMRGLRMPIGAHLALHEESDPDAVLLDAERLGKAIERTARRYRTPLAFPLMDLSLEKRDLLEFAGIPPEEADLFHFMAPPPEDMAAGIRSAAARPFSERIRANQGAVRYIAERTDLLPAGMLIGPFSLMTQLLAHPISSVALAGRSAAAGENTDALMVERCLELALAAVERSARAQIAAGAKAVIVCEPAANIVYLSPRQIRSGSDIFERFVLRPGRQLARVLEGAGVDLIFHNCGELTRDMVREFAAELRPVILSLGSSRRLWEDAAVVPKDIVLFGNLPTTDVHLGAEGIISR